MLTAEKEDDQILQGKGRAEWVKMRQRNEALDCRVYATAALGILNVNIQAVAQQAQNRLQSPKRRCAPARRPAMPRRKQALCMGINNNGKISLIRLTLRG